MLGQVQEGEIHSHCLRQLLLAYLPCLRLVGPAEVFAGGSRRHYEEPVVQHRSAVAVPRWKAGEGLFQRAGAQAAFPILPWSLVAWAPLVKCASTDVQEHRPSKQAVRLAD